MHLMFHYRCGYLQSKYKLLKIRLNVVFVTKRDKLIFLKNTTYMTTKSTNTARTLVDVQALCKQSSKAQFDFNVADIEDKEGCFMQAEQHDVHINIWKSVVGVVCRIGVE